MLPAEPPAGRIGGRYWPPDLHAIVHARSERCVNRCQQRTAAANGWKPSLAAAGLDRSGGHGTPSGAIFATWPCFGFATKPLERQRLPYLWLVVVVCGCLSISGIVFNTVSAQPPTPLRGEARILSRRFCPSAFPLSMTAVCPPPMGAPPELYRLRRGGTMAFHVPGWMSFGHLAQENQSRRADIFARTTFVRRPLFFYSFSTRKCSNERQNCSASSEKP